MASQYTYDNHRPLWIPDESPRQNVESVPRLARPTREDLRIESIAFMGKVAHGARLQHTAAKFPHIVNRLAILWPDRQAVAAAIDALLIDDRPSRDGFPFAVLEELANLKQYCWALSRAAPLRKQRAYRTVDLRSSDSTEHLREDIESADNFRRTLDGKTQKANKTSS